MEIKISQVVEKMPEKKVSQQYDDFENGLETGRNMTIDEFSSLPISKDKVIGMVIFDREKLASELFLAKRGDHAVIEIDKIQIMEESYREADFIIHAKSDILTIKGVI